MSDSTYIDDWTYIDDETALTWKSIFVSVLQDLQEPNEDIHFSCVNIYIFKFAYVHTLQSKEFSRETTVYEKK